jgi:ribosomal protein S18 acetylase RimI-like enzyme
MPRIRPVKGHYFIKYLTANYFDLAAQIECDSCEKFYSKGDIADLMGRSKIHGAIITDIKLPVGYIMWRQDRRKNTISVLNLVIKEDYRRKGLATELLKYLTGKFRKSDFRKGAFKSIVCPIRETNQAARHFLTNFGFSCSGVLRDYYDEYGESEDAFCFYLTAFMTRKEKSYVEKSNDGVDGCVQSSVSKHYGVRR